MEARAHQTTEAFRAAALPMLAADPIKHTVMLTGTMRPLPGALLLTVHDHEGVVGAVIRSEPYPLLVSAMPISTADFTAKTVHELMPDLPAAAGPLDQVEAFAAAWTKITGKQGTQSWARRLFKLERLEPPKTDGQPREATRDDLPLLIDWTFKFMHETLPALANQEAAKELAEEKLGPDAVSILWEVDGTPVSLACTRGPFEGTARVAPVYTPPEHRGHGYASAATAAATQWALDRGTENVLIFTDLANPTTNHIYPAIGYRPIEDSAEYTF